jgi:hypothetical protein
MSASPSTLSQLPLPQWAHLPGGEDDADHGTLWQVKVLVPPAFRGYVPARHPALRYRLALNDRGYISGRRRRYWKPCGPQRPRAAASASCCAPAS